ncbi:hypothetical protein [Phenylobacterium sp.]|uniref:hypothetical protein n=1 Tax=Phenylobacterium sp. TaxID=1871053 RepID=UPI002BFF8AA2|nr:hypothetical protein [Phenylobacterium sp.]HLZ75808.1 hypothetical protein [Phenylobacterium sp.]
MRPIILALSALALLTAAPAQAAPNPAPAAGGEPRLVDTIPDFARAWEATQALPDAERGAAFEAAFAPALPGFYDAARFETPKGKDAYRARLLRNLKAFPQDRAGIEDVEHRFSAMFAPALKTFEARFGPMRGYAPIYLVHSLGEFDGGTRDLPQGVRLLFGADLIARIHKGPQVQPFFHHELFHILHERSFGDCQPVWCGLWKEGLATYVASRLNPGATDEALLLTLPEPIRPAVDANRKAAVCAVTARLDSTDDKDEAPLFTFQRLSPELPPRFGYYVGFLVAQELGRTRSLEQLTKLSQAQAKPLIVAALHGLADCAS